MAKLLAGWEVVDKATLLYRWIKNDDFTVRFWDGEADFYFKGVLTQSYNSLDVEYGTAVSARLAAPNG